MRLILFILALGGCFFEAAAEKRITGGVSISLLESAIAHIEDGETHCTGTLVGKHEVLTAAHCVIGRNLRETLVWIGGVPRYPSGSWFHPLYEPALPAEYKAPFDLGIVVLQEPVLDVSPLPIISDVQMTPGVAVTAFGTGTTAESGRVPFSPLEGNGKQASLVLERVRGGLLFTSFFGSSASVCPGDSGGPLTWGGSDFSGVVGVTSMGSVTSFQNTCYVLGTGVNAFTALHNSSSREFLRLFPGIQRLSGRNILFRNVALELLEMLTPVQSRRGLKRISKSSLRRFASAYRYATTGFRRKGVERVERVFRRAKRSRGKRLKRRIERGVTVLSRLAALSLDEHR